MTPPSENRDAYIELIKRSITNYEYLGGNSSFEEFRCVSHYDLQRSEWKIDTLARPLTLLTKAQLDLVEQVVRIVVERNVPGDFIEAGVWRGGVIVLMRALLNAYGSAIGACLPPTHLRASRSIHARRMIPSTIGATVGQRGSKT